MRKVGKAAMTAMMSVGLGLMVGGAVIAAPQLNASEKEAPASASSAAVEQAHLASGLADWGRKTGNARALVLAADMLSGVGATAEARTKTQEGAGTSAASAAKADRPALTVTTLLAEAKALAGPDQALRAQIAEVAARESKGAVGGPKYTRDRVLPGYTDSYAIAFRGGERASVLVKGDGDTDLDLYVYDQNGNRICSDTDNSDTMLCQWTPAWTGSFTVKIKNFGKVYNAYEVLTN